jgi:hypothetical protein
MERLIGCSKAKECHDYRPRFDGLAWILMVAIFGILTFMFSELEHLRGADDKATAERMAIRELNLKQSEELLAIKLEAVKIGSKLAVAPSDVLPHVLEIEKMLKENHKLLKGEWQTSTAR